MQFHEKSVLDLDFYIIQFQFRTTFQNRQIIGAQFELEYEL